MMGLKEWINRVFPTAPQDIPEDLQLFKDARDRLHRSSKAFIKEVDEFGSLVVGMQGERPKKPETQKKRGKKRCTPSRSR